MPSVCRERAKQAPDASDKHRLSSQSVGFHWLSQVFCDLFKQPCSLELAQGKGSVLAQSSSQEHPVFVWPGIAELHPSCCPLLESWARAKRATIAWAILDALCGETDPGSSL